MIFLKDLFNNYSEERRKFCKYLLSTSLSFILSNSTLSNVQQNKIESAFLWCKLKTGFTAGNYEHLNFRALPASLMKLVTAISLTEDNLLTLNKEYECRGHTTIHGEAFTCQYPYGKVNITQAIAKSCNCFFIQMATLINPGRWCIYAKMFFPNIQLHSFTGASLGYVIGLNHRIKVSPIEVLCFASSIATKRKPLNLRLKPEESVMKTNHIILQDSSWKVLHEGMRMAVQIGTYKQLDPKNTLEIAAKTGTYPDGLRFRSWLLGFFPYNEPKFAFCLWAPVNKALFQWHELNYPLKTGNDHSIFKTYLLFIFIGLHFTCI